MKSFRRIAALCLLLSGIVGGAALVRSAPQQPGAEHGVVRATLPNGLRVIIVRNTLAPVVATSVNYLVGSDEAPAGFPGMAHAQEHMMFRGSPALSADQLAYIGSMMGGNFNADTREALTQYLFTVPAEDADVALHIEAARMQNVIDSKQDWDAERGAIEQEVAQDLSSPNYVVYSKLRNLLFAGTPYAHDALGTRPSFDATTSVMLKRFHDAWYAPNNAILIVVGDVEPQATLAKIKQLFGGIKPKHLPPRPRMNFQPARPTSFSIPTDYPYAVQVMAMRMPGLDSPDFPALEVLSDVLSSHRFELYGLVAQGNAIDADFSLYPMPLASMGYASVSFAQAGDAKSVQSAMRAILADVAKHGVPADLVEAAKHQERRQTEFQKNSIADLASVWADAVALYGLRSPDQDLARINKVTVADVNRVARKYLDLDHAITALTEPQGSGKPVASSGGFGGQENIALGEAAPTALPTWAQASLSRLAVPHSTLDPVVSTLPNGLTLIVQPEDVSDTVGIYGHIRNRAETEAPAGQEGVDIILDRLLAYGTEHLDRIGFQRALDELGASENAGTDFSIKVLANDFDRGVGLLADNELHPALPPAAMELEKHQIGQYIGALDRSPLHLAQQALRAALFSKDDPSLREATPETIAALTPENVRNYYQKVFRPDLTTIVVIGHVTPQAAESAIEKYFGTWTAQPPVPVTDLPRALPKPAATVAVPDASRVQDSVYLAQTIDMTRSDPDYYALNLGSTVLGGGFYSTRLSVELRKKEGLVYTVGSDVQAGRNRTVYFVDYACDPQNVTKAARIVAREIKDMQTTLVPQTELDRSKALLLRQIPLEESSIDDIARGFLERRDLDLPVDEPTIAARRYIDLTRVQVQAAFQKWMRPDGLVRLSQGPEPY
ncbi:MAG TPA: pitrilysin family protein [Rhizomicrobium sp.]|jgi:zinc protease